MSVDLLALLQSGELARLARESCDQDELARRVGLVSAAALRSHMRRLRAKGISFPSWDELRGLPVRGRNMPGLGTFDSSNATHEISNDFGAEEPTQPGRYSFRNEDASQANIDNPPLPHLPPGHVVRGVSTLVDSTGAVTAQWIKTHQTEQQRMEALLTALPSIVEPFKGIADPVQSPADTDDDLLNVFTLGDPHLGAHAWSEEVGENFDLAIAERELVAAVDRLVAVAPRARRAVVLDLGDFFHFDNVNQTTTRGTRQDADTRWHKVLRAGIRAMRRCVDRTLETHDESHAIVVPGNHDWHTSTAMALALEQFYEREPRVTIDTTPDPYKWVRHGSVLIMSTHGDESKAERLMGVMATDRAEDWGQCKHRYILCGHLHHSTVKELPGCTVETFPTLAGRDAWHHKQGYRAQQTMCVDTYSARWGRINRAIIGVQQVRALLAATGAA